MTNDARYEDEAEISPEFRALLTLDRVHGWALTGTVAVQLLLVGSVWGQTPVMAGLMAGYVAAALVGLCAWSLMEQGITPDCAAALGAAGTVGYLLLAGRWTHLAPPFWMGVALIGLISAGDDRVWSRVRSAAIFAAVVAFAIFETRHPAEVLGWTAVAALPYLALEIVLARQGHVDTAVEASGALQLQRS